LPTTNGGMAASRVVCGHGGIVVVMAMAAWEKSGDLRVSLNQLAHILTFSRSNGGRAAAVMPLDFH